VSTTLPPGYTWLSGVAVRAAVRSDLAAVLGPWLLGSELTVPPDAEPIARGRGAAYRATLPGGVRAVVRPYRRGGLLGRIVRATYLGVGVQPRPLRELVVTAGARSRGVAAAEVLAARIEGRVVYRGTLVTAEIVGATPLIDALAGEASTRRAALGTAAGRAVARLHAAGVVHADLNLTNILVTGTVDAPTAMLVDFDRAQLANAPLGARARRRMLRRLARSARKLDAGGTLVGEAAVAFRRAYEADTGQPCGR
jgi:3-deoxy-D-manno-octulosonic acid kinase